MYTADGQVVLDDEGRLIRANERSVIGNMQPDFTGGFINQISYKGFTLGAVFDFRVGGDIVSTSMREGLGKGTGIHTEERSNEMYHDGEIGICSDDGELIDWRENDALVDPGNYYHAKVRGRITNH